MSQTCSFCFRSANITIRQGIAKSVRGLERPRTPYYMIALACDKLRSDCCDTWELLALEILEHSATTCRNVAYLVCITHLSYSSN